MRNAPVPGMIFLCGACHSATQHRRHNEKSCGDNMCTKVNGPNDHTLVKLPRGQYRSVADAWPQSIMEYSAPSAKEAVAMQNNECICGTKIHERHDHDHESNLGDLAEYFQAILMSYSQLSLPSMQDSVAQTYQDCSSRRI